MTSLLQAQDKLLEFYTILHSSYFQGVTLQVRNFKVCCKSTFETELLWVSFLDVTGSEDILQDFQVQYFDIIQTENCSQGWTQKLADDLHCITEQCFVTE
jgi:hypothetical protein